MTRPWLSINCGQTEHIGKRACDRGSARPRVMISDPNPLRLARYSLGAAGFLNFRCQKAKNTGKSPQLRLQTCFFHAGTGQKSGREFGQIISNPRGRAPEIFLRLAYRTIYRAITNLGLATQQFRDDTDWSCRGSPGSICFLLQ